jgi:hypothetical protein
VWIDSLLVIVSRALKHEKAIARAKRLDPFVIPIGIAKELSSMMTTWLMNESACPPAVRQESDKTLNLLDVDFWLWYRKVTPKDMTRAFKMRFWEVFSTPGMYDILTESQYTVPNSNDGSMRLRAQAACPEWNEGTDEDVKILIWLSVHAGLTSECASEVIEPFARRRSENAIHGTTWNEAARRSAARTPHRRPKAIAPAIASSSTLVEKQPSIDLAAATPLPTADDSMVIDDIVKPVTMSRRHADDLNPDPALQDLALIMDSELEY